MTNRISAYLNPDKLVPSTEPAEASFDDFMVRRMAGTLGAMLREGVGTKEELLEKYSKQMFSVDAPQYCAARMLGGVVVAPYRVFQWSQSGVDMFRKAVNNIIDNMPCSPEQKAKRRKSWDLIFVSFELTGLFIVWRMAWGNEADKADRSDNVLLVYGAYCNVQSIDDDSQVKFSTTTAGVITGSEMSILLKYGMLTHISDLARDTP